MSTVSLPVEPRTLPSAQPAVDRKFRLIPRLDADPRVVAFCQTTAGKLVLLTVFGLGLSLMDGQWALKLAVVAATTFLPKARRLLVVAGTVLCTDFFWFENSNLRRVAGVSPQISRISEVLWIILPFVLLSAVLMWAAAKYSKSLIGRHPVLSLLGIAGALVAVGSYAPVAGFPRYAVWAFLLTFCSYFWYLAYAISDRATGRGDSVVKQFGTFHPFWGGTEVPFPKGSKYWRKIEAKTPEELAVTMIKGVKLMVWCLLLGFVKSFYMAAVYQKLRIPATDACVSTFLQGRPLPLMMNWLSWPADFLANLLLISIWGHRFIAICRMAGFRALRNTYSPLSSKTIAEYWNRYYYYFKELLVDMFFYPAFIRCFKRSSRLRIFFATFVAAGLGNTLYHFLSHLYIASNIGLGMALWSFRGYLLYSVVLALGISFSQIRSLKPHPNRGWLRDRVVAPACVLGFYCLVHVFEVNPPGVALRYLAFLVLGG